MSSDITKQICLWMTIYIYIYMSFTQIFILFICMYVWTKPIRHKQDAIQDQFVSGVQLIWIQFSFSRISCHTKAFEKQTGFELDLPSPLHIMITVMPPYRLNICMNVHLTKQNQDIVKYKSNILKNYIRRKSIFNSNLPPNDNFCWSWIHAKLYFDSFKFLIWRRA